MRFFTLSTFAQKIFKGWGCNLTWSYDEVMRSKSMKKMFVARIIRHKSWMTYAFFTFCSKIIFDQKLFVYFWDEFYYPGSIVYLSCSLLIVKTVSFSKCLKSFSIHYALGTQFFCYLYTVLFVLIFLVWLFFIFYIWFVFIPQIFIGSKWPDWEFEQEYIWAERDHKG